MEQPTITQIADSINALVKKCHPADREELFLLLLRQDWTADFLVEAILSGGLDDIALDNDLDNSFELLDAKERIPMPEKR